MGKKSFDEQAAAESIANYFRSEQVKGEIFNFLCIGDKGAEEAVVNELVGRKFDPFTREQIAAAKEYLEGGSDDPEGLMQVQRLIMEANQSGDERVAGKISGPEGHTEQGTGGGRRTKPYRYQ